MNESAYARLKVLLSKRNAYRNVFGTPQAPTVLADLRQFCHANKTTAAMGRDGIDPVASAQLEGRRQVWLRILGHMKSSDEDIHAMIERIDHD